LSRSEDDLNLNNVVEEFFIEINTVKTKIMAFRGKEPVRSKIYINNKVLEQVHAFNYLGCNI
jgi:hypothetical protein